MQCNKCGSKWETDKNRSSSLTVCPFCQESLVPESASEWQFFDNTKELLAFIAVEYGTDALFTRKHFSDHIAPLMPQGQKNLVKYAYDCGSVKILQDNMNSDAARKEIAVKQAVSKLIDVHIVAHAAAERIIWEFTNALSWGMAEPQAVNSSQNTASSQKQTTSTPKQAVPSAPNSDIDKLMTRAWMFAEDGDWSDAADKFNKILDSEPTYAPAYLGLICVDFKLSSESKLENIAAPENITNHKHYKRASTDPDIKARLDGYVKTVKDRIVEDTRRRRVQVAYDFAYELFKKAQTTVDYNHAIATFKSIDSSYEDINKDIEAKIKACQRLAKRAEETALKKPVFPLILP